MRIYIDGELNAKKTGVTSGPLVTNGELRLGLSHYVFFKGIIDEVKVTANESYFLDDDVYMHGKHSWQVTGGSSHDLVVGQTLSSEVVEYLRQRQTGQNRGVCFSFWYKPGDVISSGEKNEAQAKICYYDAKNFRVNITAYK